MPKSGGKISLVTLVTCVVVAEATFSEVTIIGEPKASLPRVTVFTCGKDGCSTKNE